MRKGIVQLVAIGIVIAVALTLTAVLLQWLPTSASEEFDRIQAIYWFATVISIAIFSLVTAVIVFSVWKWRVPDDDDADGPPIHGHTGLEILWTAVPAVLVTAIGIVSAVVLARNGEAGNRPLEVHVDRPAVRVEVRVFGLRGRRDRVSSCCPSGARRASR